MDNNIDVPVPGGATPAVETPAALPVAQPAAPVIPVAAPATPPVQQQFQGGGSVGSKFMDGITLTDVIVGSAVVTALALAIYYYRQRIKNIKTEYPLLRSDVDQIRSRLDEIQNPEMQTQFG